MSVYGPNLDVFYDQFWCELNDAFLFWGDPWCVWGDFNVIRFSHERTGDQIVTHDRYE